MAEMDERLKKRILLFYAAAGMNVLLMVFALVFGRGVIGSDQMTVLLAACAIFTLLNLIMPRMLRKKWEEDQARLEAQRKTLSGRVKP